MKKIYIVVEEGMVTRVLSNDPNVYVEIIDKDTDDSIELDFIDKKIEELNDLEEKGKLHNIW